MKKLFALLALAMIVAVCAPAQVNLPLNGAGPSTPKQTKPTSKMLTGTVSDKDDKAISGAVVYLKNSRTLVVKSFFTQENGSYRFPQLALNTDYEIWAEKDGKKSPTKTVSQFDDRYAPTINLSINLNK
jgi:Carboxypeptidase regulatory-like domain